MFENKTARNDNVRRNLIINMLKFVTNILSQFVLRTALIYTMGVEYIGLNGLFTNIFAFLDLAELGIGSAIVFSMYKPIADGDTEKVKALQNLYKKFYFFVFLVVLTIGGIITPFIKVFIWGEVTVDINIYLLFIMYLVNTLCGYLSAHKRSLLFAYQRADLENGVRTIKIILMTVLQAVVLFVFKNYYIFFGVNIFCTIFECIYTHYVANKYFPEINGKSTITLDKSTTKEISKNVMALSLHKIGNVVVNTTDSILVSSFLGVVILGAYSNYYLIITAILSIITILTAAVQGSVGNMIASESREFVYEKFKVIDFIYSYVIAFATICFVVLIQPFISAWTGGGDYMLEFSTVIILSTSMYLSRKRISVKLFKECAGLFKQDIWKPIVEAVVNLVVSIVGAIYLGINGIFLGTIFSTLVAPIWIEPIVLYKHYFHRSSRGYFGKYLIDVIITIAIAVICYVVVGLMPSGGLLRLILKFAVCIVLSAGLLLLVYLPTKECKEMLKIAKMYIRKIFKRG